MVLTTFDEMTDSEFVDYSKGLLVKSRAGSKRREAVAYLQSVNSSDKVKIDALRSELLVKQRKHRRRQKQIETLLADHDFDFVKSTELFVQAQISDADMLTKLTENDRTVFIGAKSYTGDIAISGNNVKLDGEGTGVAKDGTLVPGATIVGNIILSGENITLKGIDFTSAGEFAITVNGAKNITLEDCKFQSGAGSDTKFYYGDGCLGGDVKIKNCIVQGFTSWMLADLSTSSATPTVKLGTVEIDGNYFKNNMGCFAVRGMQDDPNTIVSYTNNKWSTDTLHASFWDAAESNNAKKTVFTGNELIFPIGTEAEAGKKGVLQTWSRSAKPWHLVYKDNTVSNIKFALKIPCTNTFYAPNIDHDDFEINLDGVHTNVTYALSLLYKKNNGSQSSALKYHPNVGNEYTPTNFGVVPNIIPLNPHSYALVQPS